MSPRKHRVSSHDLSRSTIQQSVLNLVNCIVGAGVLGYPYCFKSSGYMLATVIMLVCLVACRFSYQLMLYCTQLTSRRTFEDMAEQATGQLGKLTITLCVAALNLGSIVAYLNILADVLSSVAGTIIPPGAEPSRSVFLAGVTLFGALPVALIVRDHHVMASFSMASVGFIVLFACVIVLFACLPTLPYVAAAHGEIRMWRMDGLLVAFPVMAYSFTAHPYYLGIFTSMQKPTQAGMLHVTDTSLALAGGLYWLVGLAGYVTFRSRTAGDLLRNFGAANVVGLRGAYERAVKLCYGLSILGSVPLVILPFYNIVLPWVGLESSHRPAAGMHDTRMKSRQSDDEEEVAASTHPHSPSPLGLQGGTSRSGRISDDPVMRAGPHALGLNGSGAVKRGHTSSAVQHTALEQPLPPALEALGEGQATDIVDLRLQHDGHHEEIAGSLAQHVLVVSIVLGMAMASAIWVPNVEFIFGLTGATASVIISYIMPALIFIRLVAQSPELTATSIAFTNTKVDPAGGGAGAAAAAAAGKTDTSNAVEMSSVWVWRRRKALALLVFGLVSGIACTDAILSAVKEEAVVVQLAQQLAAHEAVVVETTRAQTKAQEAVAAVSVVQTASAQLGLAQANASSSLGKLQRAADALSGLQQDANAPPHNVWDLRGFIKDVSRSATDHKVLSSVEAVLLSVTQDVAQTRASVAAVLGQLDDAIAQLRSSAAMLTNSSSSPGAATTATSVMPGGSRVADLATELGKALGGYSSSVTQNVTAGKSLQQVRVNAASALAALDQTIHILHTVQNAVRSTKQTHHHDKAQLTQAAVAAMQAALNATATSNLAMRLTADALMHSASQETDELLSILTQVASNLQRSRLHGSTAASVTRVGQEAALTPSPSPSPSPSTSATSSSPQTGSMSVNSTTTTTSSSGLVVSSKQFAPYPGPLSPWGRGGPAAALANSRGPPPRPAGGEGAVQQGLPKHSSANSSGAGGSGDQGQTGATASPTASSTDTAASTTAQQKAQALKKVIADLKDLVGSTGNTSSLPAAASSSREEVGGQSTLEGGGGASSAAGEGLRGSPGSATDPRSPPQPPRLAAGSAGSQAQGSTTVPSSSQPVDTAASSQGLNSSSSSSSTAGGGQGQGVEGEVDVEAMALVLKDAVALTADTQSTVIQEIQDTLGRADAKVQERVVGILKDMTGSSIGKVASEPTAAAQPPADQTASPKPGRAHAGPAAGGVGDQAVLSSRQAEQQQGEEEEQVVGPTVIVDTQGRLHQQDDADSVSGPVVKQDPQGSGAGVATSSNASTPTASLLGVGGSTGVTQKVNRKFGAGADSS